MVKVVQAITAKVGAIGKVKIGNYEKCCFVLFLDQSQLEESRICKNLEICALTPRTRGSGLQR